jgi:hypothetical protein
MESSMNPTQRPQQENEARRTSRLMLSFAWLAGLGRSKPARAATPPAPQAKTNQPASRREDASGPKPVARAKRALTPEAEGRRRERERCAAIFQSRAGQRNMEFAKGLAFDTDLTSAQALAILEATPVSAGRGTLDNPERAARNPKISATADPPLPREEAIGRTWDRAFRAVNPNAAPALPGRGAPSLQAGPQHGAGR